MSPRLVVINTGMLAGLSCEQTGSLIMERTILGESAIRLRVIRIAPWPDMSDAIACDLDIRTSWRRVAEIGHIIREKTGLGHGGGHTQDPAAARSLLDPIA